MRILSALLTLALVADAAVASSSWLTKAAYNKWQKTELEQWLSDHDIPYPTPADRKDLQDLVQEHWADYVVQPFHHWDSDQLSSYLELKGQEAKETAKDATKEGKEGLLSRVQEAWHGTEDQVQSAYLNVKDWILGTWTDSQLKAFCDHHGIPVPQPRTHDVILQKARNGYESVSKKKHQSLGYPGNWLYDTWSDSDLKQWLDEHGFPAPQPSNRDKLIATVRRNSYLAYIQAGEKTDRLKKSAHGVFESLADSVLDTWSESELKKFCDKNGINVPQGSKVDEIRALVRKRRAEVVGDTAADHAWGLFGAATTRAGNEYAKATDTVSEAVRAAFDAAADTWSESRLQGFLDARGVPVPHKSTKDELRALVRKNAHRVATGGTTWTFDDLSYEQLRDYLLASGDKAAKKAADKSGAARDDLVKAAQSAYDSASKAGSEQYAAATSYLAAATQAAKGNIFDTWSESELKAYLDTYGIPVPQGSTVNELRAYARKQATYFRYGTQSPTGTLYAKANEGISSASSGFWGSVDWLKSQLLIGTEAARKQAEALRKKFNDEL
ncbi:meiotic sister chromatid recombination protein ish1 [Grosmannia clavigera kw1407]|uniref:Meiotic sister chromatid recombination protein ish1 n=1 Tax=Grosmannia clavigera (strain kw1407 / UAMH 11150) TaxID=655863 RepID=F0XP91_GROCL|nr:meiotic sister chromatid recombination protein ish1 [Grosmannia clavigera kw1407]EFX00645.1 meiotic sister chromatid recombination protein ish1 [Grosmannia clavigera kw1407]